MWVCSVCGLELDDSIENCPFGCGTSRMDEGGIKMTAINPGSNRSSSAGADCGLQNPRETSMGATRLSVRTDQCEHHEEGSVPLDEDNVLAEKDGKTLLVLTEGKTGKRLEIDSIACVLGRDGDYCPEIFSEQVSRIHMEVSHSDEGWRACHVGLNPSVLVTSTGRINMEPGIEYPLHGGDRIRMANQTFMVNIETVEDGDDGPDHSETRWSHRQEVETSQGTSQDAVECWCVACPKCGTKYRVQNSSDHVRECAVCVDPMDKREIRKASPIFGLFREDEFANARG